MSRNASKASDAGSGAEPQLKALAREVQALRESVHQRQTIEALAERVQVLHEAAQQRDATLETLVNKAATSAIARLQPAGGDAAAGGPGFGASGAGGAAGGCAEAAGS